MQVYSNSRKMSNETQTIKKIVKKAAKVFKRKESLYIEFVKMPKGIKLIY